MAAAKKGQRDQTSPDDNQTTTNEQGIKFVNQPGDAAKRQVATNRNSDTYLNLDDE